MKNNPLFWIGAGMLLAGLIALSVVMDANNQNIEKASVAKRLETENRLIKAENRYLDSLLVQIQRHEKK